jgi:hypothetical protein
MTRGVSPQAHPARQRRARLTPRERAALLQRQGGCCVSWGCTETRGLIEEHSTPFTWTGEKADQLMCVACHKAKTRRDIKAIAKVKRLQRGRKPTKRPIKSRGFDKTRSRKMNGEVVRK